MTQIYPLMQVTPSMILMSMTALSTFNGTRYSTAARSHCRRPDTKVACSRKDFEKPNGRLLPKSVICSGAGVAAVPATVSPSDAFLTERPEVAALRFLDST